MTRHQQSRHWNRSSRGFTLIEIVAGTMLMGTLLTLLVLASAAHLRQIEASQTRIAALEQLDILLEGANQQAVFTAPSGGELPGVPGVFWTSQYRPDTTAQEMGARVVRVECRRGSEPADRPPICCVEMLILDDRPRRSRVED